MAKPSQNIGQTFLKHVGNFDVARPTALQLHASRALQRAIATRFGQPRIVDHNEVAYKTCPGKNFPSTEQWKEWMLLEDEEVSSQVSKVPVKVDGQVMEDKALYYAEAGITYIPTRLLRALGLEVVWRGSTVGIEINNPDAPDEG